MKAAATTFTLRASQINRESERRRSEELQSAGREAAERAAAVAEKIRRTSELYRERLEGRRK